VDFGLFYEICVPRPWQPGKEAEVFRQVIEQVRFAEEMGFKYVWLTEHHFLEEYCHSTAPEIILAAASQRTKNIRLGFGIMHLPPAVNHPARVAERIATLDLLSSGRVVLGMGFGWNRAEAEDHGVDFARRRAIARDKVLCMQALWDAGSDTPEYHGPFVDLPPCYAWPKPLQQPRVRTLVGGGAGPATFAAIAEYADGWMPIGAAGLRTALPELRRVVAEAGRDPASLEIVPFGTVPDGGKLEHLRDLGVTEVVLRVPSGPASAMVPVLDDFVRYLGD